MSNDPNKSLDEQQQQGAKTSIWPWFSSTKAPRSSKTPSGTNPTTHATPTQLPRFDLSTPSSSAAPTTNGFPSAFSVGRSSSGMPADVSAPTTDSKPAATTFGTRATAGGYSIKTPSALTSAPGSNTAMSQQAKSPWKNQSGVINGVDPRGLSGANLGTLAAEIRQQQNRPILPYRRYKSKSALISQRNPARAGTKRSLQEDPELFRRAVGWSQQSLKRVLDASASSRDSHGFDRFLPQRALGANQSGTRVPLSDSHTEDEEDEGDNGPPNKKARKVTFEPSGGRTPSEPSWNARKTPIPKSKRSKRSSSFELHDDDDDVVASESSWNRFPRCPHLPPFDFSPGGDQIRHFGRKVNPSFRMTHAGKRRKAGTNLSSFESELQDANFDEAQLVQQRAEVIARAEEKEKTKTKYSTDDEGEPWICSSCQNSNPHDETYCQKCQKSRSAGTKVLDESKTLGWGSNMFPGKTFGLWKCTNCSIATNPPTATVCPSCLTPRPGTETTAVAAAVPAPSTGSNAFFPQNATPAAVGAFSFGLGASSAGDSVSGQQNTEASSITAGNVGGFMWGIKSNAGTDGESNKASSQPFSGSKVPEKPLFGLAAPSAVNQEPTTSSTGGFSFGLPQTNNAATSGGFSFGVAAATTDSSSSGDKESKETDGSNQVKSFLPFGTEPSSQPPPKSDEQTGVAKSAGEQSAAASKTTSGLNASAPAFSFGGATAAPSVAPVFAFGGASAPAASSTESLIRNAPNELDETSRGEGRSKKLRPEDREGGDSGGTTPFPTSTTPAFALFGRSTSPTAPSSQTAAEAGNGVTATSSLFGTPAASALFGTPAPKAPSGEATLLTSSSTPAFGAFGSSSNTTGPSGVSAATEGFALNASTAPALSEQSGSAAATLAPGTTPRFSFGSTPAAVPAFQFGSTPAPGASSTPAPAATAFGNLGASSTPAPAATAFGNLGASSTPAPAGTAFGNMGASSTPAPAATAFGNMGGANPLQSNTPAPATTVFGNLGAANPLGGNAAQGSSSFNFAASATPAANFGGGSLSTPSNPPTTFGFGGTPAPPAFGSDPFASQGSTIPSAGFTPVQPFGMPPIASTPGGMSFGAPAATPVGNGFGSAAQFGSAPTPVNPGFGGGFGASGLAGLQQQDINFSIGSAGSKGPSARGGRRFVKAKRPR